MAQGRWEVTATRASAGVLFLAWVPIWALYALLIGPANPVHPGGTLAMAALVALRSISIAALLGLLVKRLTDRVPWPHPFQPRFALIHLGGALLYAHAWFVLAATLESRLRTTALHAYFSMLVPNIVLGMWLYAMIAGTLYAARAARTVAQAEANAVRAQLAALRSQLNPHFLFNALHAVVQLIPDRPRDAAHAAELVAGLLRTSIEEDRDLVPVGEEIAFVQRYLEVERMRFGDRLEVRIDVSEAASQAEVPSFAIQTLVENAVRHGAAPRVEPTTVTVTGRVELGVLTLTVSDNGVGAEATTGAGGSGTGLRHLRERLKVLFGPQATLTVETAPGAGYAARLTLPASEA